MKNVPVKTVAITIFFLLISLMHVRLIHAQSNKVEMGAFNIITCLTTGHCENFYGNPGDSPGQSNPGSSQPPGGSPPPNRPDPTTPAGSDCPIRGGRVICGSKTNPRGGCSHCSEGYLISNPTDYDAYCTARCPNCGTETGLDVAANKLGDPIYFPKVGGKVVEWTWVKTGKTTIQGYSGYAVDNVNEKYWLQLHHTLPGSGKPRGRSGDIGANICLSCLRTTGPNKQLPHTHVQLAVGSSKPSGGNYWLDASVAFCN